MVSIVIPAYNAEKFIAETIESIISQTYKDWEIIIVVDGATDNTATIAKTFCSDNRISVIEKPNTGVSDTRNVGMSKAQGEYIAFLDADDVWLPENLQKKVSILDQNPHIGWTYSNMFELDNETGEIKKAASGIDANIIENILRWEGEVVPCPCSNILMRKSLYDNGIKFDINFSTAADQDFILQLPKISKHIFINEYLFKYRMSLTSMHQNISLMEKDHINVYKKADSNGMFKNTKFRKFCFAKLYLILAGSWWKNGNNKKRGFYFLIKSFFTNPLPIINRLLCRKIKKKTFLL